MYLELTLQVSYIGNIYTWGYQRNGYEHICYMSQACYPMTNVLKQAIETPMKK